MINTKRNTEEKINTTTEEKTSWTNQKTNLRTEFPSLTDEDLDYDHSKKNEMLEKLSVKLGKTPPELLTVLEKQ